MVRLLVNNRFFFVKKNVSILEACKFVGIKIPRFCFHENLSVAGNCRMCLVETDKSPKPIASCASPVMEHLSIITKGPRVLKSRENILEILLLNHPLDCPICDQGGECDLQDQAQTYGTRIGRGYNNKRGVEDKYCGVLVKTIMNRCIHCTRCVRFGNEICGIPILGTLNRGINTEIGTYVNKIINSPISANVVDLCPVGALTLKTSAFVSRPWELKSIESVDLTDGLGSNIYINYKELDVIKVSPKKNKDLNQFWVSDKGRFVFDSLAHYRTNDNDSLLYFNLKKLLYSLSGKRNLFLINKELSLKELNLLKQLSFVSKNKFKIKVFSNEKLKSNYYLWGLKKKISEISLIKSKICLFLSTNLDAEASLLNTRLRSKYLVKELEFYSFGNFIKPTFPLFFLRFGVSEVILLFSSKNKIISKLFLKTVNPIILSGKSLMDRINLKCLDFFLLKNPSIINYTVYTRSNEESIHYLNFNFYNKHSVKSVDNVCFLNLEDSINLYKLVKNIFKNYINFAAYNSKLVEYCSLTIPVLLPQEVGGVYLNLEQRPQKVMAFEIKKSFSFFSLKSFFLVFIETLKKKKCNIDNKRNNFELIFDEVINHFRVFVSSFYLFFLIFDFESQFLKNFKYSLYPLKLVIEDYLRTNNITKHSNALLYRSRELRKLKNDVYI